MAGLVALVALSGIPKTKYYGTSYASLESKVFSTSGPGRNQRKRRKLARQSPNSKYAK